LDRALAKRKFFEKVLSEDGVYTMYLRLLDVSPLFSQYAWLQLTAFDLAQLGMSLLHDILSIHFEPYRLDFRHRPPTAEEVLQGIWAVFEPVDWVKLHGWMKDFDSWIGANVREEHQEGVRRTRLRKCRYDESRFDESYYDPPVVRELLRAAFWKLRLIRAPDASWLKAMGQLAEEAEMAEAMVEHVYSRLTAIYSAQLNAFVLGLSVLGRSRLTEVEEGWGTAPFLTAGGEARTLRFTTLDQLQMGLILGLAPLGYGLLMPKESIYAQPEGKRNPPVVDVVVSKVKGIISRLPLTAWAYGNYSRPEEMLDYHRSERTAQHDFIQEQRRIVEGWVAGRVPPEEANPVRVRQYQNAALQALAWRAKRHRFGFDAYRAMTEAQFKSWWVRHWSEQGLSEGVLEALYEDMSTWLPRLRLEKEGLGERVRETRFRLARAA